MPITFRDEQMLNDAFSNLNQTLMNNRVMKAQAAARQQEQQRLAQNEEATQAYRKEALGQRSQQDQIMAELAQARLNEAQTKDVNANANAQAKTTQQDNALTTRLKQNTIEFHDKQIQEIIGHVNQGSITPQQGTQMIKQGVSKWDDWEKQSNPLYAQYSAPDFTLTAKTPPTKTSTRITTGMGPAGPINETNVTTTATSPGALSGPAPSAQPPTVDSQQAYDVLPKGRQYYDPQGNLRTKQ